MKIITTMSGAKFVKDKEEVVNIVNNIPDEKPQEEVKSIEDISQKKQRGRPKRTKV